MLKFDLAASPSGLRFEGYASLFDRVDLSGDVVRRGAFAASLAEAPPSAVRMLYQHEAGEPVGVWDDIREDDQGLFVRGRMLPAGVRGRAAARLVASRAVDGLSIGYRVRRAVKRSDGVRELIDVELWEISIVTFPMLPQARLKVVADMQVRELEQARLRA
jgi:HK97 family phage prohead protease